MSDFHLHSSSSANAANPHCVACGHSLSFHTRHVIRESQIGSVSGCHLCSCDAAVPPGTRLPAVRVTADPAVPPGQIFVSSASMAPVSLQSGDTLDITQTVTFGGDVTFEYEFEHLIARIQALTGLNPRKASVIAVELDGINSGVGDPDHLIVAKAKELGYLPDSWRLP